MLALAAFAGVAVVAVTIVTSLGGGTLTSTSASTSTTGTPSASSSASSTTRAKPRKPRPKPVYRGPYAVGTQQQTLVEPPAAAGTSARTLPTTITYPMVPGGHAGAARWAPAKPFPLIVFSQGFATDVSQYNGLLATWTKAGYVVAAPAYPYTSLSGPLNEQDIVNHPGDLSYVIAMLVKEAQDPHNSLHRLVNTNEIAVAGQSDGGDVSLAVAANTCCIDHAVKAAVILSGAELGSFGGTYFSGGSVPLLVTQGDQDTINFPSCSATLYNQAPGPKYFVNLLEQEATSASAVKEHLGPYTEPGATRSYVSASSIAFLDSYLKGKRAELSSLLAAGGEQNVATITSAPSVSDVGHPC